MRRKTAVEEWQKTILADMIETLTGAIYLDTDAGSSVVTQIIEAWIEPGLETVKTEKSAKKTKKRRSVIVFLIPDM